MNVKLGQFLIDIKWELIVRECKNREGKKNITYIPVILFLRRIFNHRK